MSKKVKNVKEKKSKRKANCLKGALLIEDFKLKRKRNFIHVPPQNTPKLFLVKEIRKPNIIFTIFFLDFLNKL